MSSTPGLAELREILSELFPTIDQSRIILADTQVPTSSISFKRAARENWYEILMEAHRHGKVSEIVAVARKNFPNWDEELTRAEEEYLQSLPEPPDVNPTDVIPLFHGGAEFFGEYNGCLINLHGPSGLGSPCLWF